MPLKSPAPASERRPKIKNGHHHQQGTIAAAIRTAAVMLIATPASSRQQPDRHKINPTMWTKSNRPDTDDRRADGPANRFFRPRRCRLPLQPRRCQPTSRRQHHNVRLSPNSPATSLLPPDPPKPARLPPPCIRPLHRRHSRINLGVNLRVVRRGIIRTEEAN